MDSLQGGEAHEGIFFGVPPERVNCFHSHVLIEDLLCAGSCPRYLAQPRMRQACALASPATWGYSGNFRHVPASVSPSVNRNQGCR